MTDPRSDAGISGFVDGIGGAPTIQVVLRVVPFAQRSLAMGIHSVFVKILVIPAPIILGMLKLLKQFYQVITYIY